MNKFESGLLVIICLLLLVIGVVTSNLSVSLFALFISLLLWKKNQKTDIAFKSLLVGLASERVAILYRQG